RSEAGPVGQIGERAIPVVVVDVGHVIAEVGLYDVGMPILVVVRDGNAHACLLLAVLVQSDTRDNTDVFEGPIFSVVVQEAVGRVASDVQVGVAIGVEIGCDDGEAIAAGACANSARRRDIIELAITPIVKQMVAAGGESARPAHYRKPLPLAVTPAARGG